MVNVDRVTKYWLHTPIVTDIIDIVPISWSLGIEDQVSHCTAPQRDRHSSCISSRHASAARGEAEGAGPSPPLHGSPEEQTDRQSPYISS